MSSRSTAAITSALLLAAPALADVEVFSDFASYNLALSGNHDLFVDFETDADGSPIAAFGDADGNGIGDIDGGTFSDDVVYSSPQHPGFPARVNIATISPPVLNEIGPLGTWDGVLCWSYPALQRATGFTGIEVEPFTLIRFYAGNVLVDQAFVGGTGEVFDFYGFVTTNPFDRVELEGDFYAIDGHYSTLAPECYLVLGRTRGAASFEASGHTWTTQLGDIFAYFPVLLDDIPSFSLPVPRVPFLRSTDPDVHRQAVPIDTLSVQVLMNNRDVFPANPEQFTHGLEVTLWSNGRVTAQRFGTSDGMGIELERGIDASGKPYFRFPFSIAGLGG
jgi:hypothetical protein